MRNLKTSTQTRRHLFQSFRISRYLQIPPLVPLFSCSSFWRNVKTHIFTIKPVAVQTTAGSNVASPRSQGQVPQCGKELLHLFLQKSVAVLCILPCPFRVPQFDLQHALLLPFLLHLLLQTLHLCAQSSTRLLQPVEGSAAQSGLKISHIYRAFGRTYFCILAS